MTRFPCRAIVAAVAGLAWLFSHAGCARPLATAPNPFEIDEREYSRIFEASVAELRDRGFDINRDDFRFGVITTRPQRVASVLEPWRDNHTTFRQDLAGTVNAHRRLVSVWIEPLEPAPGPAPADAAPAPEPVTIAGQVTGPPSRAYHLRVEVVVERHQRPDAYLNGSTNGHSMVSRLQANPAEYSDRGIPRDYWLAVGRDPYLEQQLVTAIVRRSLELSRPNTPPPPTAAPGPAASPAAPSL